MSATERPAAKVVAAALVVVTVSAVVLVSGVGGPGLQTAYTDLVQLAAAVAAACTAAAAARRTTGRARLSWAALSAASASWAVGETIWTWYELVLGEATPFPSFADIGFLGFPLVAAVGLLLRPTAGVGLDRKRTVLDASLATGALALVSWQTVLGAVLGAGGTGLEQAVSLAYPVGDALLLALVALALGRSRARTSLGLTAAGIAALALSDSAFVYLAATGTYNAGALDLGWIVGFVLLALAPLAEPVGRQPDDKHPGRTQQTQTGQVHGASVYPYVPLVLSSAVTLGFTLSGRPPNSGQLVLASGIVGLLLLRQYLTLRQNAALTVQLAQREAELRRLAFHDPLTGLANRALFYDRLTHALELHARDQRPVSVIFLDLDDFKLVNDRLGHAAGDELLIRVAERLSMTLRRGDTVARLGGDEFALLLEDGAVGANVADAVSAALRTAFVVTGSSVQVGASIGLVHLPAEAPSATADVLLVKADTAMYAAKRAGKGRLEVFQDGMSLSEADEEQMSPASAEALAAGCPAEPPRPVPVPRQVTDRNPAPYGA